jgi:very-short-patch-repair endonuclease
MPSIIELLESNRRELLDTSTRNRLLSMPLQSKSARIIHVSDEKSDQVFRILVTEKKTMSFAPRPGGDEDDGGDDDSLATSQPEDGDLDDADALAERHIDNKLQTTLVSESLQKRLLSLHRDAQALIEEQGVNVLYLALGRLTWIETSRDGTERHAPLLLIPVELTRQTARQKFTIKWSQDEIEGNLSLAAKLKQDFGIELTLPEIAEDFMPSAYFARAATSIASQPGWRVEGDAIALGFFSFAKFLMYRDLDPANWPDGHKLLDSVVSQLLQDGFPASDSPFPDSSDLDEVIPVNRLDHVVDADSSQAIAIELVRRNQPLVIQGPPGTGKSQTITNLIATAVLDGKRVLFVAEKLAALQVVKRRLQKSGLGDICLELHSNKTHKVAVIRELERTWQLGAPRGREMESVVGRLEKARKRLNDHVTALHERHGTAGVTFFRVIGALSDLHERGRELGTFDLPGCENWSADDFRDRRDVIEQLSERVADLGTPSKHAWYGVERDIILNIDLPRIEQMVADARDSVSTLMEAIADTAALLQQPPPDNFSYAEVLRHNARHAVEAPPADVAALGHAYWSTDTDRLRRAVDAGRELSTSQAEVDKLFNPRANDVDAAALAGSLSKHGKSLVRFFNKQYKQTLASTRDLVRGDLPKRLPERLTLLQKLVRHQALEARFNSEATEAQAAFGTLWKGAASDWDALQAVLDWVAKESAAYVQPHQRQTLASLTGNPRLRPLVDHLAKAVGNAWSSLSTLIDELPLNLQSAFGCDALEAVPLADLHSRSKRWHDSMESLTSWCAWFGRAQQGRELGLSPIIEALHDGRAHGAATVEAFDRAYYEKLLRYVIQLRPELGRFDGAEHSRAVQEFRELDKARIELAKYRVLEKHHSNMPAKRAGAGATGMLLGEMQRKRGHRAVRRLLSDAGPVVQQLKPVFMMSPLSVAQFLAPGSVDFDLLIIDEASQVLPVDALGAFARARQHVVVGDRKQLPPTRFFARLTGNDSEDEEEEELQQPQAKDMESILSLCCARGMPETTLRWHYRSRHHSLIAVSNREFYEDKLFIVPSPVMQSDDLGVRFRFVENGVYDRGGSATNRIEAQAVVEAVLKHMRSQRDKTLGVAAFSMKQQQMILDELELVRRENADIEEFFHLHEHEPFFVKNLENVQGDERDVILISVGFGKDASGYMTMNFGPLNGDAGERRLNVLITRARQRCEVFASIRADDIDLARAKGRGVQAFKTFLKFAETDILSKPALSAGEEMSPFEVSVRRAIEGLGYEVHPQVGVAGFFIDLGIVDPDMPGRYLLGVECDGATYHSSLSARDRDRLRQAVLEDQGWAVYRIWSTDWFQRPQDQLRRVGEAIETARLKLKSHPPAAPEQAKKDAPAPEPEREQTQGEEPPRLSVPYQLAQLDVPKRLAPHEVSANRMAQIVKEVARAEGPIHEDELVTRIRDLWGLQRAGSRIQEAVFRGMRLAASSGECILQDGCVALRGWPIKVRDRSEAKSASLRRPELLPPPEIRQAIHNVVSEHHGATADEVLSLVPRMFGFKATSEQLRNIVQAQIARMLQESALAESSGVLQVATAEA